MAEGSQRRLAAIVSADVVGFSRLMQSDEAGTHARLKARFRDLVAIIKVIRLDIHQHTLLEVILSFIMFIYLFNCICV